MQTLGIHRLCARGVLPAVALLLAGCSTLSSMNPVNWWHDYEGGKIAEQRQPLPGSDGSDPNLASVPVRPAPPDRDAMKRLTQGLVADRENARYSNASNPLPDPSSATASPALFGAGTLPPVKPAAPAAVSASLQAATTPLAAPEQPAAPPSSAPRKPVQSAPLAVPEAPAPLSSAGAPELPPLPGEPPPRPGAAPVPLASMPASSGALVAAPQPSGTNDTTVAFDPGSSTLAPATVEALKQVATHRKGGTIALTGYGDATSSDPAAQAAALSLAVRRAKAVAGALQAAGVPAGSIQMGGEAAGRGVLIRLLQ